MATQAAVLTHGEAEYGIWRVVMASSVGTMIEWYDFYIFGSLAVYLSPKFYPPGNDTTIDAAGQQVPAKEAANPNIPLLVLLVFIQVIFVCMIYGPIAAYLVEAFPARIRYTSLSLPYHIGDGVFGGLLPLIGLTLCARTGNIYAGLYYPMIVAAITLVTGSLLLKETHGTLIWDEYNQAKQT